jgi:hypothetical protein
MKGSHQFDLPQFHPQPGEHSVFPVWQKSESDCLSTLRKLFRSKSIGTFSITFSDLIAAFSIDSHGHTPRRQLEVLLRPLTSTRIRIGKKYLGFV